MGDQRRKKARNLRLICHSRSTYAGQCDFTNPESQFPHMCHVRKTDMRSYDCEVRDFCRDFHGCKGVLKYFVLILHRVFGVITFLGEMR